MSKNKVQKRISKLLPNYEMIGKVGEGSFGVVIEAVHKKRQIRYAIKRLYIRKRKEKHISDLRDIENELEALSQLRGYNVENFHPNIVGLYAAYIEELPISWLESNDPFYLEWKQKRDGAFDSRESGIVSTESSERNEENTTDMNSSDSIFCINIVQQLCSEGSLRKWLNTNKERDAERVIDFGTQLADGMRFLHARSIVHKDVKPENVFLSHRKNHPSSPTILSRIKSQTVLKWGDFGLSVFENFTDSSSSARNGTNMYLSKDPAEANQKTKKSDIYALGLILMELIVPFRNIREQLDAFRSPEKCIHSEKYSSLFKQIHEDFSPTLVSVLSITPELRNPTASELHDILLGMKSERIELPVYYGLEPKHFSISLENCVKRSILNELLQFHDGGTKLVCLRGGAGTGKTTLARQFSEMMRHRNESVVWVGHDYKYNLITAIERIGNFMNANVRDDVGKLSPIENILQKLNNSFRGKKWTLILDNAKQGSADDQAVIINCLKLSPSPFVLAISRDFSFAHIADSKIKKNSPEKVPERFLSARMVIRAWSDFPTISDEDVKEVDLKEYWDEERVGFFSTIFPNQNLVPKKNEWERLGYTLDWNPLALNLAVACINAHEALPRIWRKSIDDLIKTPTEYITLFKEFQNRYPIIKSIPPFYGDFPGIRYCYRSEFTENYVIQMVMYINIRQIHSFLQENMEIYESLMTVQFKRLTLSPFMFKKSISIGNLRIYDKAIENEILKIYGLLPNIQRSIHVCRDYYRDYYHNSS